MSLIRNKLVTRNKFFILEKTSIGDWRKLMILKIQDTIETAHLSYRKYTFPEFMVDESKEIFKKKMTKMCLLTQICISFCFLLNIYLK